MTKRNVGAKLVGILIASVAAAASCSFPTYNIPLPSGTSSGAGGAGGSSGSAGGGGASSTTSAGSTSSATSSSAASSSAASSSGTGVTCIGADVVCDCDDDKVLATSCAPGTDCNDHELLVHTGQTKFFKDRVPGSTNDYDYDCDDAQTFEIKGVLICGNVLNCDQVTLAWKGNVPACGVFGQLGKCKLTKDLVPACIEDLQNMQKQGCR